MKYKEFHLVSTGALRASTLVSRSSPWTYPPPSSPSFSSLSSSSGLVMGESPGGVSFNTCCFYKWQSSSVARVDFLACVTNALALLQTNQITKKPRCRNMEVNVRNQSWVHWSMHLAKYVCMKRADKDVAHCTHVLLTQHANHLCNNAIKIQYH